MFHASLFCFNENELRQVTSVNELDEWQKHNGSVVAFTKMSDGSEISTIFTGIDFQWSEQPLLFDKMVIRGEYTLYQEKYASRNEAEQGHQKAKAFGKGKING